MQSVHIPNNTRRRRFINSLVIAGLALGIGQLPPDLAAQYPPLTSTSDVSCHPADVKGFRFDVGVANSRLGHSVSGVGDVNGDGYEDVVLGAPYSGATGQCFLIYGSSIGFDFDCNVYEHEVSLDTNADGWRDGVPILTAFAGGRSGFSVSGAGDVNGDGFDDFVLGIPYANAGAVAQAGVAAVVFGSSLPLGGPGGGPLMLDPVLLGIVPDQNGDGFQDFELITGTYAYGRVGISVGGAGDFNSDGFDDLIIGQNRHVGGVHLAHVVFGASAAAGLGLPGPGQLLLPAAGNVNGDGVIPDAFSFSAQTYFGDVSVSGAGDVNGDGFDDIIFGSPTAYSAYGLVPGPTGQAYVLFGTTPQPFPFPAFLPGVNFPCDNNGDGMQDGVVLDGFAPGAGTGTDVFGAGDKDGDGFDDVGLSTPYLSFYSYGGAVTIVFGSPRPLVPGTPVPPPFTCPPAGPTGHVTWGAFVPDQNGDGLNDLSIVVDYAPSVFSYRAAPAGDVDGDGFPDMLSTNPQYSSAPGVLNGKVGFISGAFNLRPITVSPVPALEYYGFMQSFLGDNLGDSLGSDVSSAGDFNGDGFHDFVIGSRAEDGPYIGAGVARLIYGRQSTPVTPNATAISHTRSGNAPERGIGLTGTGSSMMPSTRAWLNFSGGNGPGGPTTSSTEKVTFYRDTSSFAGFSGTAVAGWEFDTDRAVGFPIVIEYRFNYPETMLGQVAESSLRLFTAPDASGPWAPHPSAVFDLNSNMVRYSSPYPTPDDHFLIAGSFADSDKDFKADSCELAAPGAADTNIILRDSDGDGFRDGYEDPSACALFAPTIIATNPRRADTDNDGYQDRLEMMHSNVFLNGPLVFDALALVDGDLDGLPSNFDLNDADEDSDDDGYGDLYEYVQGTDPNDATWRPPLGDVNGSGSVDLVDVAARADYNLGISTPPEIGNGDLNIDGLLDIADVATLADFNLGVTIVP